ncbi:MAG: hypothetical protein ABEK16_06375 [Candidatus Nanohalobium sp.]
MFKQGQLKSLGIATALIILNIAVMWIFAFTPLAAVNDLIFPPPQWKLFLGVIVYGAMLTGGVWLAKKGVRSGEKTMAAGGASIIQLAYGMFGAGIIGMLPPSVQALALGITGIVTTAIAVLSGLVVFGTGHDFSNWGRYANYIFLSVLAVSFIGSFSGIFALITFTLALIGFIVYLIHQIYVTKTRPGTPFLNGIGLYTAYMGVFVQILQIVVEMLLGEE